jgi:hypothetical protein
MICGWMFRSLGKKGGSGMTPFFNNKILNHPFTGTALHTVASKSRPERFKVSRQIGIHLVLTSSHGTVLAFPQKIFCSKFDILSHDWLSVCSGEVSSQPHHTTSSKHSTTNIIKTPL